jgi:hypothetical protein
MFGPALGPDEAVTKERDSGFDAGSLPAFLLVRTASLGIGSFLNPLLRRSTPTGGCFRIPSIPGMFRTRFGSDSVRVDSLISTVTSVPKRRRRRTGRGGTVGWLAETAWGLTLLAAAGFFDRRSSSDGSCRCRFVGRSRPTSLAPDSPPFAPRSFQVSAEAPTAAGTTSPSNWRRRRFGMIFEFAPQRVPASWFALATICWMRHGAMAAANFLDRSICRASSVSLGADFGTMRGAVDNTPVRGLYMYPARPTAGPAEWGPPPNASEAERAGCVRVESPNIAR